MTETGPSQSWSDEELPQPRRELPGGPWPLRVLGVAVVAAALVTVAVRGGGSSAPHPAPRTVVAGPHSIAVAPPIVMPGRRFPTITEYSQELLSPPECPAADDGQVACTTVRSVPPVFSAAVRSVLPRLRRGSAVTELLRPTGPGSLTGIWSRRYTAHAAATTIRIVVVRTGDVPGIRTAGSDDGRRATLYVVHRVRQYMVAVDVEAPSGTEPSFASLDRLAADRRLVAV